MRKEMPNGQEKLQQKSSSSGFSTSCRGKTQCVHMMCSSISTGKCAGKIINLQWNTFQALLTAIVVNLKNLIRLLIEAATQPSQRELSIPQG
jgi:hypothetical protein